MPNKGSAFTATFMAWDTNANAYKTGEAANITAYLIRNGISAAASNPVAEADATNFKGAYTVAISSAEADVDTLKAGGECSTANVVVIPIEYALQQPATATLSSGTADDIAERVWDMPRIRATVSGTFGQSVLVQNGVDGSLRGSVLGDVSGSVGFVQQTITATLGSGPAQDIAYRVWDTPKTAVSLASGTFGRNVDVQGVTGNLGGTAGVKAAGGDFLGTYPVGTKIRNWFTLTNGSGIPAAPTDGFELVVRHGTSTSAIRAGVQTAGAAGNFGGAPGVVNWSVDTTADPAVYTSVAGTSGANWFTVAIESGLVGGVSIRGFQVGTFRLGVTVAAISGDVTGNIIGNVVGSVGSVTAPVTVSGAVGLQDSSIRTETFVPEALDSTVFAAGFLLGDSGSAAYYNAIADALLDRADGIETGMTPRQSWRGVAASQMGELSGAGTTAVGIRQAGATGTATRISAVTDQSGNRVQVTTNL